MLIKSVDNFEFDVGKLVNEYDSVILKNMKFFEIHPARTTRFKLVENHKEHESIVNMPYTQEVMKRVGEIYEYSDVVYRAVLPGKEYNWHIDYWSLFDHCYHIPLITNVNCNFIYVDTIHHMPVGKLYKCMTNKLHNFRNDGTATRIHLTFERMKNT